MVAHAIRQIGLSDRAVLAEAIDTFAAGGDRVEEWITGFVADHLSFAFVALGAEGEVLGWIWGSVQRPPIGPSTARIEALEVVDGARRSGVGAMLFDAAFAHARRLRCGTVVADLPGGLDDGAQGFVESLRPMISSGERVRWSL